MLEGGGNLASDASGWGNNGTLTNGPVWSCGGLLFDGVDDYITASIGNQGIVSIAVIFSVASIPAATQRIGGWEDSGPHNGTHDKELFVSSGAQAIWYLYDNNPQTLTAGTVAAGVQTVMVGTVDGTTMRLYLQGVQVGSQAAGTAYTGYTTPRIILAGDNIANGGQLGAYFAGTIYSFAIYNRALTASEVWELYEPRTRWDLYYQLGRKTYSFKPAAAGGIPIGKAEF